MSERKLRFALFGNVYQAKKSTSIQKVISCLSERKAEVYVEREFYHFVTCGQHLDLPADRVFDNSDFDADFVISLGGDGTLLKAAAHVASKGIPIMGVNMGRLGFLADVSPGEIDSAVDALYRGDYTIEDRVVMQVEADGELLSNNPYALNDISVLKRDNASMISIRANVNKEYLVTYQADGLVISTPTGSTAYSLSNGGPIIVPQTGVFCITPVAPHSLNIRPIVVNDDSVVSLTVESRSHNFLVAIDGRSEKCKEGTRLVVRKAPHTIRIIRQAGSRYFSTLREKMMWGLDSRG